MMWFFAREVIWHFGYWLEWISYHHFAGLPYPLPLNFPGFEIMP